MRIKSITQIFQVYRDRSLWIQITMVTLAKYVTQPSKSCRIHQMRLCKVVRPNHNAWTWYDIKTSDSRLKPWRFRECGVILHCFKVESDPEWHHLIGFYLRVKQNRLYANKWLMLNSDCYILETLSEKGSHSFHNVIKKFV